MADQYTSQDRTYTKDYMGMITAGNQIGVLQGLLVTESSPAAMTVDISRGRAWFEDNYVEGINDTLAIAASDPADDRKDLIYITHAGVLTVSTGVAAPVPVPPSIGDFTKVIIAQITVPAAVANIVNAYIRDERHLIYGNKYKDVFEGSNPDSGVCKISEDNENLDSNYWTRVYNPMKEWGG